MPPSKFMMTVAQVYPHDGPSARVVRGPARGDVHTGDHIGVWRDGHLVSIGTARIELICFRDDGATPIVVDGAVARIVRAGDIVQRLSDHPAGLTALLPHLEGGTALGEVLADSEAQQLICFALTVSDYWATKALDQVERGTSSANVLSALRAYVDAAEHPQPLRHRALRTLRGRDCTTPGSQPPQ